MQKTIVYKTIEVFRVYKGIIADDVYDLWCLLLLKVLV